MGLLSSDYYDSLSSTPSAPIPAVIPTPAAPTSNIPAIAAGAAQAIVNPASVAGKVLQYGTAIDQNTPVQTQPLLTPEEQTARFGGPVGSAEYYKNKSDNPLSSYLPKQLASAIGIQFPADETWDQMSRLDQGLTLARNTAAAASRLVTGLPKAIVRAPLSVGATILQPWVQLAKGQPGTLESTQNEKPLELPWLGQVPTYFQSYKQAVDSGMGPKLALLSTGSNALGDVTMTASLGESLAAAMKPRSALKPGETVQNVQPIKDAITRDTAGAPTGAMKQAPGSPSEYYSLPRTVVKSNYGTSPASTMLKITPAGEGATKVSVVELRGGTLQRGVDWTKNSLGFPEKNVTGDFGPERTLESKIVQTKPTSIAENPTTVPKAATSEVPGAAPDSATVAKEPTPAFTPEQSSDILKSIPPKPLKGFEDKPVTSDQLTHLQQISAVNGIDPAVRDAVIRTVTGTDVAGEMTQAGYVKSAQTLAALSEMGKFTAGDPALGFFSSHFTPARHWTRSYEETSGIPLYSGVYVPMEEGTRLAKTAFDNFNQQMIDLHGKYAGQGFAEERRLIAAHLEGNTAAIAENTALDATTKAELVGVADKWRALMNKMGPALGVPESIFLKNYLPGIQDIGGVVQKYKTGASIPGGYDFFAKFKKTGSLGVKVDDSLALGQIYAKQGARSLFLDGPLKRAKEITDALPASLKDSVSSYVLEKLGYADRMEQALNSFIPGINKKLGINLPEDTARQAVNYGLSTVYSGLLSSPATWFRQTFQYPMFGYARMGPKFAADAMKAGLFPAGMAEAAKNGFLVDLGMPYGEELTKDVTTAGKIGNTYKAATQTAVAPVSIADNAMRSVTYHQSKMIFEDALSKYNAGKLTWDQFENAADFKSLSTIDQNIVRQKLVAGDIEGAKNHYIRDIVDDTNFPYRKGASARVTYGLTGKLSTSLLQWPIEAAHTMGRWMNEGVRTGDFSKLIRFGAASYAIQRTMKETFGFDFTKSMALGPFNNFYSPFVKTALDSVNAWTAWTQNNKQEFNKNEASVMRSVKSMGMPAGVELGNFQKFMKSYNAGPNSDGQFAVYNDSNQLQYYTDFSGLFWGQLMGMPTEDKMNSANTEQEMLNAQTDQTEIKAQVMKLLQQEKYDEAGQLMAQSGVTVTPQDLNAAYIPLNQRTFQNLPKAIRAQFVGKVYPQTQ